MRPIIGITCSFDYQTGRIYLPQAYAQAVEQAGGLPILLPWLPDSCLEQLLSQLDGILLSGGVDVDPAYFGEDPLPALGDIAPERDLFELALVKLILKQDLPLLAICRGIQVLNIAAGGNIYQDLHSQLVQPIKHSQLAPRWHASHKVAISPGTSLAGILQVSEAGVNSFHHQAIKDVAPGFRVTAIAPDGIIEAIESTRHQFVLGVQWHPECMWEKDQLTRLLFQAFIQATKGEK